MPPIKRTKFKLSPDQLLEMLHWLKLIRGFDERLSILVKQGDAVTQGQTLVLLDAMKMELPIRAPADGVVTSVHCREGDLVPGDAPLVDLN